MNRLAVSYAFNCSHPDERGVEQIDVYALAFLVAIAYRIPSQARYETEPTTLEEMAGMTKVKSERQLRMTRDLLVRLGEVREGGEGAPDHRDPSEKRPWRRDAIYQLPGLAGPLFLVTPWDVDMTPAQREAWLARQQVSDGKSARRAGLVLSKSAQHAGFVRPKSARHAGQTRHNMPTSEEKSGGVLFSVLRSTNNHHDDDAVALITDAAQIAADDLFSKLVTEYPLHNNGAPLTVARSVALPLLVKFLEVGYQPDKVLQMAVKCWTVTGEEPGCNWIPMTNRSLQVMWQARDTLARLVFAPAGAVEAGAQERTPCLYKHEPPCSSASACRELELRLIAERDAAEAAG